MESDSYQEFEQIFIRYCTLAKQGNLEAAKRGMFLMWYEQIEPPTLSGILKLPLNLKQDIIETIEQNLSDPEIIWMLPYYYQMADWYLNGLQNCEKIIKMSVEGINEYKNSLQKINPNSLEDRGLMGNFWLSILHSGR